MSKVIICDKCGECLTLKYIPIHVIEDHFWGTSDQYHL